MPWNGIKCWCSTPSKWWHVAKVHPGLWPVDTAWIGKAKQGFNQCWSEQNGCAALGCCRQNIVATINGIFLFLSPNVTKLFKISNIVLLYLWTIKCWKAYVIYLILFVFNHWFVFGHFFVFIFLVFGIKSSNIRNAHLGFALHLAIKAAQVWQSTL